MCVFVCVYVSSRWVCSIETCIMLLLLPTCDVMCLTCQFQSIAILVLLESTTPMALLLLLATHKQASTLTGRERCVAQSKSCILVVGVQRIKWALVGCWRSKRIKALGWLLRGIHPSSLFRKCTFKFATFHRCFNSSLSQTAPAGGSA